MRAGIQACMCAFVHGRKRVERHRDCTNRLIVARTLHHWNLCIRPLYVRKMVACETQTQFLETLMGLIMSGIPNQTDYFHGLVVRQRHPLVDEIDGRGNHVVAAERHNGASLVNE